MRQKLQQGVSLVVDRYTFSGVAFTSAKPGFGIEWRMSPDVGLPKPDLVVYLQVSPAVAAQRGEFRAEHCETSDLQKSVLRRFQQFKKEPSLN